MIKYIFAGRDLLLDFETDWQLVNAPKVESARSKINASALEIEWSDVSGAMAGQFILLGSSDGSTPAIGAVVNINKASTDGDSWIFKISSYINYIKIIYKSNGTLTGKANAKVRFSQ